MMARVVRTHVAEDDRKPESAHCGPGAVFPVLAPIGRLWNRSLLCAMNWSLTPPICWMLWRIHCWESDPDNGGSACESGSPLFNSRLQRSFFRPSLQTKLIYIVFFEKGKKIRGNSHEFIMKTAPERGGTQYTSSYTVFGIFFFAFKSRFSKSEKNAGKTRENDKKHRCRRFFAETLRFSDGIYFDP